MVGHDIKLSKISKESDLISIFGYDNIMEEDYDSEYDDFEEFEIDEEEEMNETNNFIEQN